MGRFTERALERFQAWFHKTDPELLGVITGVITGVFILRFFGFDGLFGFLIGVILGILAVFLFRKPET